MVLIPVHCSAIAAVGYDGDTLAVVFTSSDRVYEHHGVPSRVYFGRLLDPRLSVQVSEAESVAKKCALVNRKGELRGKLEAFAANRQNRFEPASRFVFEAKHAAFLLAGGNSEQKRDFLKKIGSNRQMADKTQARECKLPWHFLAEINSHASTATAAHLEKPTKPNWRRGGDSNPRYGF
jgi:hypothetical protein